MTSYTVAYILENIDSFSATELRLLYESLMTKYFSLVSRNSAEETKSSQNIVSLQDELNFYKQQICSNLHMEIHSMGQHVREALNLSPLTKSTLIYIR